MTEPSDQSDQLKSNTWSEQIDQLHSEYTPQQQTSVNMSISEQHPEGSCTDETTLPCKQPLEQNNLKTKDLTHDLHSTIGNVHDTNIIECRQLTDAQIYGAIVLAVLLLYALSQFDLAFLLYKNDMIDSKKE